MLPMVLQARRRKPTRKQRSIFRPTEHGFSKPTEPVVRDVEIPETIVVADLAKLAGHQGR